MKTCIYCGRTYPKDVRVCPACGLNLEQAPENIMGPIEIDVEPEEWIPPHQHTPETRTPPPPQAPQPPEEQQQAPGPQRAMPEPAAAQTLSPELMRIFRGNQYMYGFRMLLLIVIALCLLLNNWLYNWNDASNTIGASLTTVVPGLLFGFRGLVRSLARLRKTSGELAAQVSASPHGATSLFSAHERIVLKAPVVGVLLGAGALYAAYFILSNTPLMHIVYNLSMLSRISSSDWWYALNKANGGIAWCTILLFCLSYPIRTLRLFLLRGKVIKTP